MYALLVFPPDDLALLVTNVSLDHPPDDGDGRRMQDIHQGCPTNSRGRGIRNMAILIAQGVVSKDFVLLINIVTGASPMGWIGVIQNCEGRCRACQILREGRIEVHQGVAEPDCR